MPFQGWPFSNIHNVNLDWILTQLQEVFRRLTDLKDQIDRLSNERGCQTEPFAVNIYKENELWHCSATPAQLVANAKNCYITINGDDGTRIYPDFVDTNSAGSYVVLSCDIMEDAGTQDWVQTIINISWRYGDNDITVSFDEITAYNENPSAPGTASPGFSNNYARGDHRHPKELPNVSATDNGKFLGVDDGVWEVMSIPTDSLEEIRTYTCDGNELSGGPFYLSEDNNGSPFRLKKLVMRVTLGTVTASGTFSANAQNGTSKTLAQAYANYNASATGQKYLILAEQDSGYWTMVQHSGFSSSVANLGSTIDYEYTDRAADYPYIDRVRITRAVPAGTVIEILGVRT